jgi:hypothetical protein
MTRIMKMVPASRFVTEASLEPPSRLPSFDRSRAVTPLREAVVDSVSITATAEIPKAAQGGGDPAYQRFVKIRLGGDVLNVVIPGHAKHEPGISRFQLRT